MESSGGSSLSPDETSEASLLSPRWVSEWVRSLPFERESSGDLIMLSS